MSDYVAADVVETPWGKIEDLRGRRLQPGPGTPREVVVRNQRERLFAAMVATTAVKGYPATTVADLIGLAGVSRATFYVHFGDKADCFKATVQGLLNAGLSLIRSNLERDRPPAENAQAALDGVLRLVASQPAAARMSLVDSFSAGPAGLEPINDALEVACELVHQALGSLPGRDRTPEELSRAVVGGLHRVFYHRLHRGEVDTLVQQCDQLWDWATGYPPPSALPKRRKRRSEGMVLPPHAGRDSHERILRGFAAATAAKGFPDVTIPQVAAATGISNATFYQHFENKQDALLAALDLSGAQLTAATLPAARRESDWPQSLRRALEGVCGFLASEPAFARLRAVEVYAAGPDALAHRDRAWEQVVEEVVPAEVREGSESESLKITASSGAVHALVYERVRRGELEKLRELPPLLTYIMLVPLIGVEEATEVAGGAPHGQLRPA